MTGNGRHITWHQDVAGVADLFGRRPSGSRSVAAEFARGSTLLETAMDSMDSPAEHTKMCLKIWHTTIV